MHTVRLTISLKKAKVVSQGTYIPQTTRIDDNCIENIKTFVYLGSSIASNSSIEDKIEYHIGKDSGTFARQGARVSDNPKITIHKNLACV